MQSTAALWAAGCGDSPRPAPPEGAPNIIFITLDDLGWKSLPRYGNPNIETPAIDRIAERGAVFTRAFNASSSCSSSRATLVTGQHVARHGVNALVHRDVEASLPPSATTAAEQLFAGGYHTAHYGKWHASEDSPRNHGYAENLNDHDSRTEHIERPERIESFLERRAQERFYLELNFLATHLRPDGTFPNDREFYVDPDGIELLPVWTMPDWPEVKQMAAAYFSQVRRVDAILRHVLETLEELGLLDDTLIVLTSDNGAPFPGNKRTLFDRGIGTPLIVSWPGGFGGAQEHEGLVSAIDIAPTLLDAAMVDPLPDPDGRSLLGLLRGAPHVFDAHVFAAIDYHGDYTPLRAVRSERYKLVHSYEDTPLGLGQLDGELWAQLLTGLPNQDWNAPLPPVSLYDLETDPHEQVNLVDDPAHADVLERMHARLQDHLQATGDVMAGVVLPPYA